MLNMALANAIVFLTIFFLLTWVFVALVFYFIPLIVAHIRRHQNIAAIAVLNIVLGWTFIGWLASLLWALNSDIKQDDNDC